MKSLLNILLALAMIALANTSEAQGTVTEKFEVGGVCEMCKERIEKTLDVKGVRYANYDLDSHQLEVVYKTKHISSEEIHQRLNDVGHDTEKSKASDEAYDKIHGCCKYREHEHDDHDEAKASDKSCSPGCSDDCSSKKKKDDDHDDHDDH
jgi:copper chaperone CopZ